MLWPLCPACSTTASDKSRSSSTKEVQAIWEINLETSQFVPLEVGKSHRWSHSDVDVDFAWRAWCADVEHCLVSGRQLVGPCLKGGQPFRERDSAVIPQKAGGSRAPGRLHRPAWTESLDAAKCQFFIIPFPR